jgi:phosphohistidine swiveling domain-containing protein
MNLKSSEYVLPLADRQATLETVGGKGASLARLVAAGLPVPDGFHVTTAAYWHFVAENDLHPGILAALEPVDIAQPATLEAASTAIRALFAGAHTPPDVASAIALAYAELAGREPVVAVRSSATAEDLPDASFAGQQETFLNVQGAAEVLEAIKRCWASLWTARAIGYRARQSIDHSTVGLAVVVQELVPAEAAGILFTANPLTGRRDQAVISAAWGLGEAVVGGLVTPDTLTVEKATGRVLARETADKQVMVARVNGGTEEQPVPDELRLAPVLGDEQAAGLARLGVQIEELYGMPMDIEWALADGAFTILQARPITALPEPEPVPPSEWNATFGGDYLWTNMIVGEVFPTATTPSTWSVWQDFFSNLSLGDSPTIGNIAGRPYLNYSLMYSFLLKLTRKHERVLGLIKDSIGVPPAGVGVPSFPVSWRTVLFQILPREFRNEMKKGKLKKAAPDFLAMIRDRCPELRRRIGEAQEDELISLWTDDIKPLWKEIHLLQDKMNEELQGLTRKLKTELTKLLGDDEANTLLTTINGAGELASLGPLVGLSRLNSGELSREEYLQRYGHRGPHENELAEPRPCEDPNWLDIQLAELAKSPVDVTAMLEKRDAEFEAVQQEITHQLPPKKAQGVARIIAAIVEANTLREATRSELTRIVDIIRVFFLRASELSGLGDGVFFLTVDELVVVLSGDTSPAAHISTRRQAYEKYRALPPLPAWIRGRFDPFQWAADPNRRRDVFDTHLPLAPPAPNAGNVIRGQPGSAGHVEGIVQRIDGPDEGDRLQPGEILVTSTTNVGWTPLFPRAAAVVTDIGGSLSHAAIVARELGIPAVVGCGDATMRLKPGDRVRVDGRRGIVEILEKD